MGKTGTVIDPFLINSLIQAWKNTHHLAASGIDADIASKCIMNINSFGFFKFPRARLILIWF